MWAQESALAAELTLDLYNSDKKSYQRIAITEVEGVKISKNCLKSGKMHCAAWKAVGQKAALTPTPGVGTVGNPAARYCHAHNANNRILLDAKKREYDYCVFSDGSMVDAWSLYNKHFQDR